MNAAQRLLKVYLNWLLWPGPRIIFEIGACQGEDTKFYLSAFSNSQIFAFEPLPANYQILKDVVLQNANGRGKAWELAVSDSRGEASFHVSSGSSRNSISRSSSLFKPREQMPESHSWLNFSNQVTVRTETMDCFCEEHGIRRIDFIHMDVQGAELKVLNGAQKMLPHIGAIWMEVAFEPTYQGQPLESEVTGWMVRRGFRKIHQVGYGPEGDALFLNMRSGLLRTRFVTLRLLQRLKLLPR